MNRKRRKKDFELKTQIIVTEHLHFPLVTEFHEGLSNAGAVNYFYFDIESLQFSKIEGLPTNLEEIDYGADLQLIFLPESSEQIIPVINKMPSAEVSLFIRSSAKDWENIKVLDTDLPILAPGKDYSGSQRYLAIKAILQSIELEWVASDDFTDVFRTSKYFIWWQFDIDDFKEQVMVQCVVRAKARLGGEISSGIVYIYANDGFTLSDYRDVGDTFLMAVPERCTIAGRILDGDQMKQKNNLEKDTVVVILGISAR